jgi:excinuclease UvrABC ATPase subunit
MTVSTFIQVRGARENNLREVDIDLPRNKLIVVTGVSGSGKTSLVFDTIFKAAQAELLEMIGSYSRQSMPRVERPKLRSISGLSPAVAIKQSPLASNPRSTVGTATDIYSYMRLLFSRTGTPILSAGDFSFNTPKGACELCSGLGKTLQVDEDSLIDWRKSLRENAIRHRTWKVGGRYWNIIAAVDLFDLDKPIGQFSPTELHDLLHRESFEYQNKTPGFVQSFSYEGIVKRILKRATDSRGGKEYDDQFLVERRCQACDGTRLNSRCREVTVGEVPITRILGMEMTELRAFIGSLTGGVAESIGTSVVHRLKALEDVGLGYLSLNRSTDTLSGGEVQRLKLARQLGSPFNEIIYVMDEPSQGLHPADVSHIVQLLRTLADQSNTVIAVEHDRLAMECADLIVDMGPGAGEHGGRILQLGSPAEIRLGETPTSQLLAGHEFTPLPAQRRKLGRPMKVVGACLNNLTGIDVTFYANVLNCVTGVSGSGKSSLVREFLRQYPGAVVIDQSPMGSSSRSIVATYVDAYDRMRAEFADVAQCNPSLLAFNSAGACAACGGLGYMQMDMHFLGDVRETCESCGGSRFNSEALSYSYRSKTIADILDMSIEEAAGFFLDQDVRNRLRLLEQTGLGYLRVGQPLSDMSGGERQRLRIVERLSKKGETYVLDEPTRGLHAADIGTLMRVLSRLIEVGNTLLVVEHDLDVIKCADHIVDLGPRGGTNGGRIMASGRPEEVVEQPGSLTGRALRPILLPAHSAGPQ